MQRRQFLAQAAAAGTVLTDLMRGQGGAASGPPNLVLIFCDDLGYGDLSCYGGKIATPNLDRLAKQGMRFTQALSANPVCSPSRAALLTGRYPTRVGVPIVLFPKDSTGLQAEEQTLAQLCKQAGYRTHCVGKWHLGHTHPNLPTDKGFDGYFGIPYSNDMSPRWLMDGEKVLEQEVGLEELTPRYTARAVQFVEDSKGKPFFLYMPHTYPHVPLGASSRFRGKSTHGIYGDVLQELDWSVGQVLEALRRTGAEQNTLVLFSSDNGPWFQGSPGPLRGRKGMTWEGGVRVPLLARWPGRIRAGAVSEALVSLLDVVPTFVAAAGLSKPRLPGDGVDLLPVLTGRQRTVARQPLLYFDGWNLQCVRDGDWKLHFARYNNVTYSPAPAGGRKNLRIRPELYNLAADPDESYDVAEKHADVVARLMAYVESAVTGFPKPVQEAYAAMKAGPESPGWTGAVAR